MFEVYDVGKIDLYHQLRLKSVTKNVKGHALEPLVGDLVLF